MNTKTKALNTLNIFLGFLSIAFFIFDLVVFIRLQPKMVAFQPITQIEQNLLTTVGFGFLGLLMFYFFSFLQLFLFLKQEQQIKPRFILLVIFGVLSSIFVFSDIALLSDIDKQYHHNLSQPEWQLLIPIMIVQMIITLIFLVLHLKATFITKTDKNIKRDINIFMIVQYVGVLTGLLGLGFSSLGFIHPQGWNFAVHSVMGGITLLLPYIMVAAFWVIIKLKEKDRQWYDEKQKQDIGKSAFWTLTIISVVMVALFSLNFFGLNWIISMMWLPIYLFGIILLFSLGNLYFSKRG